jgi:hypothetical protein
LPWQWKDSVILLIKWAMKLASNYQEIALLSATYKMFSSILLSWLTSCIDKIVEHHLCGFQAVVYVKIGGPWWKGNTMT